MATNETYEQRLARIQGQMQGPTLIEQLAQAALRTPVPGTPVPLGRFLSEGAQTFDFLQRNVFDPIGGASAIALERLPFLPAAAIARQAIGPEGVSATTERFEQLRGQDPNPFLAFAQAGEALRETPRAAFRETTASLPFRIPLTPPGLEPLIGERSLQDIELGGKGFLQNVVGGLPLEVLPGGAVAGPARQAAGAALRGGREALEQAAPAVSRFAQDETGAIIKHQAPEAAVGARAADMGGHAAYAAGLRQKVAEIDALTPEQVARETAGRVGVTKDTLYRDLLSRGTRASLRRGETWRDEVLRLADTSDATAARLASESAPRAPKLAAARTVDDVTPTAPVQAAPDDLEQARIELDQSRALLEAEQAPRAKPPRFGSLERAEFDNERRIASESGRKFIPKAQTVAAARARVREAEERVRALEAEQQVGAVQSSMGIGERPQQGQLMAETLGEGQRVPLADPQQMALRSQRQAEVGRGQQELPESPVAVAEPPSQPPTEPPAPPDWGVPPRRPEGPPPTPKTLLTDLQDFDTQLDVAFHPNVARRLAVKYRHTPVGSILRLGNPASVAERPIEKAAVARAMLREEGAQKVNAVLQYPAEIGTMDDLFGPTNRQTGLLSNGPLTGRSVNEIAENTSKFTLTPQQSEWLGRMAEVEDSVLQFYRRNGVDINKVPLDQIERYAGRVVVGKVTPEGDLIEAGFVGSGPSRIGGRTGAEKSRTFTTVEQAQAEGFVYIPYEDAVRLKAKAAINRVADLKTADWVLKNLQDNVTMRPLSQGPIKYGDVLLDAPAFHGRVFSGPGAAEFRDDVNQLLRRPQTKAALRRINAFNSVQRIFALAGDASLFTIQLLAAAFRHPTTFFDAGGTFARTLTTALVNPAAGRRFRARLVAENNDLLQQFPILLSESNEFTEALGRGGFLGKNGLFPNSPSRIVRAVGRAPSVAATPLRPFQQAFETTMDAAGIHLLKAFRHKAFVNDALDPVRRNDVLDYANHMRGLASSARLGVSPNQRLSESVLLLAPRYRRALASLHADVLQGGLRGRMAREAYLSLITGLTLTFAGITIALGVQQGKSREQIQEELIDGLNPASPRFLLWRIGGQLLGPGSKFVSDARLLARILTDPGEMLNFEEFQANPGVRWVRGQLAGAPSTAWDIFVGRDYLGEPASISDPKSLARVLGDNVIPIWLQSVLFDGGTADERGIRGGAEFFGLRSFPQGALDILKDGSWQILGKPYEQAEPFEKDLLRQQLSEQLTPLQQRQVERGSELADYFSQLDQIDAERLQRLEELPQLHRGDRQAIRNAYFDIEVEMRGRRFQAGVEQEFEPQDVDDPDLNKRALAKWYAIFDKPGVITPAGNVNPDQLERERRILLATFSPEQQQYVLRNINRRPVPDAVLRVLPASTRTNILQSEQARYLAGQGIETEAAPAQATQPTPTETYEQRLQRIQQAVGR